MAHYGDTYKILGEMPYYGTASGYRAVFWRIGGRPDLVTVVSSYGGWDSEAP